jgi:hypothetical protein
MAKDLLKDSTFPDAWYDVAFEDGVAAGRAEGEAEGKAAEARVALRAVLEARFGPLADDLARTIKAADLAALQALFASAATEPLEQIRIRLGV